MKRDRHGYPEPIETDTTLEDLAHLIEALTEAYKAVKPDPDIPMLGDMPAKRTLTEEAIMKTMRKACERVNSEIDPPVLVLDLNDGEQAVKYRMDPGGIELECPICGKVGECSQIASYKGPKTSCVPIYSKAREQEEKDSGS